MGSSPIKIALEVPLSVVVIEVRLLKHSALNGEITMSNTIIMNNSVVSQKELEILNENIDELYHVYVASFHNATVDEPGAYVPIRADGDIMNVVGHLAQTIGARGAKMNWKLLNKKHLQEKISEYLTGETD